MTGSIAARKGLEQLADAVAVGRPPWSISIAGTVADSFRADFEIHLSRMRSVGANVTVHDRWLPDDERDALLRSARCALVIYPRHFGSSRSLLEAAAQATPVVATNFGLVGALTNRYGLGRTVDVSHARSLRTAIDEQTAVEPQLDQRERLRGFTHRYTSRTFTAALEAATAR